MPATTTEITMQPSLTQQAQFYNKYWAELKPFGSYKVARIVKIVQYLSFISKHVKKPSILDLGCGDGRCVSIWNEFGRAAGLDLSDEAMKAARTRYPFLEFSSGDATATSFKENSFDVIVSQEVIEHIENQGAYVSECSRLLKNDGYLIITTPNKYFFDRTIKGNYSRQPIEKILLPSELKEVLEKKFTILKFESIIFAAANKGIYRLLSNKILIAILKKIKLNFIREELMNKFHLGVHLCILARKK